MQTTNIGVIVIVVLAALAFVVFIVRRNKKDRRDLLPPGGVDDVINRGKMDQQRDENRT